ncbi:hypothetical protein Q4491_00565 [Photobacterium sp. 2_MG-2023]|nr:hypothetical protein [Photobacterium sp. 2_MG-2023]MDO6579820.1 hypothetical protein [Photobacterium sp. 2_MG-2023]
MDDGRWTMDEGGNACLLMALLPICGGLAWTCRKSLSSQTALVSLLRQS